MTTSIFDLQRNTFLQALRTTAAPDWKTLVVDRDSRALLNNVTTEDDVLNAGVTEILQIEASRETLTDTPAIYLLTPLPHIVEWLKADLSRRRYMVAHLIWTSPLRRDLGTSLGQLGRSATPIVGVQTLNIDYSPRESHLVTFRDPDSLQLLFNPSCDKLVAVHMESLAQKIVSICVSLGEYPLVRYYKPGEDAIHAARVLCRHLAKFVKNGLDDYARATADFPPPSSRPRAILLITDRSMDMMAPLVHELTYQAMAMDLLPMQEKDDKVRYRNVIRRGQPDQEEKDTELNESDKIWVENRHLHMKDLLVKLSDDFRKFQAKNPQFADNNGQNISVNTIKDMLAGLPEFQEGKEAFSLHIDMAEKCAKIFQDQKLLDVTSVEQSLATGFDEDGNIPKNLADQLVRLLDDDSVIPDNRVRLLIMYVIYRGGILGGDITKLRRHGDLPDVYESIIYNLQHLGVRVVKELPQRSSEQPKHEPFKPLYMSKKVTYQQGEEVSLSRFEPMLRYALEELSQGVLDVDRFPASGEHLDNQSGPNVAQTSLRSAGKPTWANTRPSANKPRQRIICFIAGGATFSEARACYELSQQSSKEIFLATSHMLTPKVFLREASRLHAPKRDLGLAIEKHAPQMPTWMTEPPPESLRPQPPQAQQRPQKPGYSSSTQPLNNSMQNMNLGPPRPQNGSARPASSQAATPPSTAGSFSTQLDSNSSSSGKLKKEKKEKKHLGGLFRKH